MLETEFDKPLDKEILCMLCHQPLTVTHHWIAGLDHWMHPTCHNRCVQNWEAQNRATKADVHEVPERFRDFELSRLPDREAARAAANFGPNNAYHTCAIIGPPGTGKSRLMWKTIQAFFEDHGAGWPEYAIFPDIMSDFDRAIITKLKSARYVFIDDIGSTESYGRERALLQDVIRARVQKGHWTFLTIDNLDFDKGFDDLFRDRATVIYVTG